MQRAAVIMFLAVLWGPAVFGQRGTWVLDLEQSDVPKGVRSGTLEIRATPGLIKVIIDTVTSQREPSQEEFDPTLNGKDTVYPDGHKVSFKRVDNRSFDIIASVNNKQSGNHVEENHFVFSPEGNRLTDTRTDTERETVPDGVDPTKGAVLRESTSVLVFYSLLFVPSAGPVFLRPIHE